MATSLSDMAYLNLSHARPSLFKKVLGPLSGGLVEGLNRVTSGGLDGPISRICIVDSCLTIAKGMRGPVSKTPDLDEPCLGFLLPQQQGRLPISMVLERVFLFSEATERGEIGHLLLLGWLPRLPNPSPSFPSWLPFLQKRKIC